MGTDLAQAQEAYTKAQSLGIKVNMARGNPSPEQLDLSDYIARIDFPNIIDGIDVRNYNTLEHIGGLPSVRHLGAKVLSVKDENVFALGSSSLNVMSDVCIRALVHAMPGSDAAWYGFGGKPRVLCCIPGYDRQFAILQDFAELVPIPLTDDGPDLTQVQKELENPLTVAMWCVPRYSNPTGITYSPYVAEALASLPAANPAFRLLWDDAYALHTLESGTTQLFHILRACAIKGNPHRVFIFSSTSKMVHPGSGVSFLASSVENLAWVKSWLAKQTIGPDKVNQARLITAFPTLGALQQHMQKHRALLEPKFAALDAGLREHLSDVPGARWTLPTGGYFTPLWLFPGTAKRTNELAASAGVTLTPAGATHPYGINIADDFQRLAPTFLSVEDIARATAVIGPSASLAYHELHEKQKQAA